METLTYIWRAFLVTLVISSAIITFAIVQNKAWTDKVIDITIVCTVTMEAITFVSGCLFCFFWFV